jgi:hypothetical protein
MAKAVHTDLVTARDDLARQRRVAHDLLADEEERCAYIGPREDIEHGGSAPRVRAVVERDGDASTR